MAKSRLHGGRIRSLMTGEERYASAALQACLRHSGAVVWCLHIRHMQVVAPQQRLTLSKEKTMASMSFDRDGSARSAGALPNFLSRIAGGVRG